MLAEASRHYRGLIQETFRMDFLDKLQGALYLESIMYRAVNLSVLFALSSLVATTAFADDKSGVYVNAGITQLSADLDLTQTEISGQIVDLGDNSLDITMITGRLGYRLNDYFAVEGELGFGLGGDSINQIVPVNIGGVGANVDTNADLDVKNYSVGFVRAILPVSDQFDVFGRLGYGQATAEADVTASLAGISASSSAQEKVSGLAYGVGGQFNFTEFDGIRADYTRLEETNIISVSYARRF